MINGLLLPGPAVINDTLDEGRHPAFHAKKATVSSHALRPSVSILLYFMVLLMKPLQHSHTHTSTFPQSQLLSAYAVAKVLVMVTLSK